MRTKHFIFDMEDEIINICRTFSLDNKKQQQNLIETIKQNCRKSLEKKLEKNLLQILILQESNGNYWLYYSLCTNLVDSFFFSFACWYSIK